MQSNAAKTVLGVVLFAAAIFLFIVLSDSDSESGMRESTTTVSAPSGATGGSHASQQDVPDQSPGRPKHSVPTMTVRDGAPVGGVEKINVAGGDRVRFKVISDEESEVHIHGYDITEPVRAGRPVTLDFPADLQGGYGIELHSNASGDTPIADLVVDPG